MNLENEKEKSFFGSACQNDYSGTMHALTHNIANAANNWFGGTVEPLMRGQHGDEPFVLSREVVLFRRFLFLSLKMKHSSRLDTNTTNKRECNQLSHESVDVGSFVRG